MSSDLESVPYNTARNRTDKRKIYNDTMERSTHHYVSSAGFSSSANPHTYQLGTPMRKIANPPPGKLTVS
ncbi:hypothetical protein BpHYR1_016678 [Brachionus plicatilis]|nr:hypothetical protein BpHYR1_016678 [Brachionus plicatilis]